MTLDELVIYMYLPNEYKTGNKKMDERIARALKKDPLRSQRTIDVLLSDEPVNKYHVATVDERTYQDGTVFASKREMKRWHYLLQLEKAGEIEWLRRQTPFLLQDEFIHHQYGKIKPIHYVSDFDYINISFRRNIPTGSLVVEDSKGKIRTVEYKNKRKMFLLKYPEYYFFEV